MRPSAEGGEGRGSGGRERDPRTNLTVGKHLLTEYQHWSTLGRACRESERVSEGEGGGEGGLRGGGGEGREQRLGEE